MRSHTFRPLHLPALLCGLLICAGTSTSLAEDLSTSSGAQLYQHYCASCHGTGGAGDGPVAPFFRLTPADLTLITQRSGGTFPAERVRRIVDGRDALLPHGTREMPVWGMQFELTAATPAEGQAAARSAIARLVEYLRSIQKPAPQR